MGKSKTKAIQVDWGIFLHVQAYLDISRHIQAYSWIFRNYSGIFWTLCNPNMFRTLVYLESWHIQNQRHIQNPGLSKTLAHSESWDIQKNRGILRALSNICEEVLLETANSYNYFCKLQLFSQYQPIMPSSSWNIYDFFDAGLIFTLEVFIQCKKVWGLTWRTGDHEFWFTSWKFYSDITY